MAQNQLFISVVQQRRLHRQRRRRRRQTKRLIIFLFKSLRAITIAFCAHKNRFVIYFTVSADPFAVRYTYSNIYKCFYSLEAATAPCTFHSLEKLIKMLRTAKSHRQINHRSKHSIKIYIHINK